MLTRPTTRIRHRARTRARAWYRQRSRSAGALLGLDARKARFLLSYAAQQAAGLSTVYRDAEHIEKASLSGMPAHNGATAALMAAAGFTGVDDVFTGERS